MRDSYVAVFGGLQICSAGVPLLVTDVEQKPSIGLLDHLVSIRHGLVVFNKVVLDIGFF